MEIDAAARIFGAMGQERRLAVLKLLIGRGPNGLSAGELADQVGMPGSTTSFHLSALERAGLVFATRQKNQIIYAVRITALRGLLSFLTDACCDGHPELCGDIAALLPPYPEERSAMTPAFNVLFLCTRNSARSIMAEAILASVGGERFHAYSAGSEPATKPMPEVIEKLQALGHDISGLHCKSWNVFLKPDAPKIDFVLTLCDAEDNQTCPELGEKVVTASWSLPDPAQFKGSAAERSVLLNELYAGLLRRIRIFVSLPFEKLERMALKVRLDEIGEGPIGALVRGREA